MVEKNVAYNRDNRSGEFANNDPLAELAHIVGFADRSSHLGSDAAQHAASPASSRDAEFNLEDELLREFEVYDAPHVEPIVLDPANDMSAVIHSSDFMQRVESVFARREPKFAPVVASAAEVMQEPLLQMKIVYEQDKRSTPVAEIRADFRNDTEDFEVDMRDLSRVETAAYDEADWQQRASARSHAEWHEMPALPADTSINRQSFGDVYGTDAQPFDLANEVERTVADEAPPPVSMRPSSQSGRSSLEFSSLRLPLANFGARRDVSPVESRAGAATVVAPLNTATPATSLPPVQTLVCTGETFSTMNEPIYDVAKYFIPARDAGPVMQTSKVAPPIVAAASAFYAPAVSNSPSSVDTEPNLSDFAGFNEDDFELALGDLDLGLELSEIAEVEEASQPQPVRQQQVVTSTAVFAAAALPVREPAPVAAPVVLSPSIVAPIAAAAAARQLAPRLQHVAPETLESLPFDPSQISESEEHPETILEMDVPELPVGVLEPRQPIRRHEDDLDIDTELATLFAPVFTGDLLDRHRNDETRGAASQTRAAASAPQDVDEFEMALEEDFRRSMQEVTASRNQASCENEIAYADHQASYRDQDKRSGYRWMMSAVAVLSLVLISSSVYPLLFGGSSDRSSGDATVIISADNDPMKVIPNNPGGRVVLNQDKAVYDHVAGGSTSDPKQSSLISSNEEPVDVVQRTLIPEQLPLEGENDAEMESYGKPFGETEDPRLLSPEEKAAQTEGLNVTGVLPRKVRTMVVKPDGTLVAHEVDSPAVQTPPRAEKVEEFAAPKTARPGDAVPAVITASRAQIAPDPTLKSKSSKPSDKSAAAPIPAVRPSAQSHNVVVSVTNQSPAVQKTAAAAPATTTTASSNGYYYIQIASLPSQVEAQKSYQNMSSKFDSVIGGRGVDIKATEIAGKGIFYRVRIPAGGKNEAVALCEKFRAAGGSCLVAH